MTLTISRRDGLALLALALLSLPCKAWFIYISGLEMHYDEAQYWEWSRQLDWSYYSKGPLVAWLIALSEAVFGHGAWQVRLPAWLAHGVWLVLLYRFTLDVWQQRSAAWWSVLLVVFTPMYFTLSLPMTTDILLLTFWTWGLWATYRALIHQQSRAWYEVGAAVGLGALTKLSIGLLPALIGIAVVLVARWRPHLRSPQLWLALLLMLLLMSPLLIWNAQHDWVMLRHEAGHVGADHWSLKRGLNFILGQILALSPLAVLLFLSSLRQLPKSHGVKLLLWSGVLWSGFFIFKALNGKVQVNWPAPSYIGLVILLAGLVPGFGRIKRYILYVNFVIVALAVVLAYFPYALGLSAHYDPLKPLRAWRTPVQSLYQHMPEADFILTSSYKLAGELAFYWPHEIPLYVAGSAGRRYNQHDLWPSIDREAGNNGLWVSDEPHPPAELSQAFGQCSALAPLPATAPDGTVLRTLYAWRCYHYQVITWPQPSRY